MAPLILQFPFGFPTCYRLRLRDANNRPLFSGMSRRVLQALGLSLGLTLVQLFLKQQNWARLVKLSHIYGVQLAA